MALSRWLPLVAVALTSTLLAGLRRRRLEQHRQLRAHDLDAPTTGATTTAPNPNVRDAAGCFPSQRQRLKARSENRSPARCSAPTKTYEVTIATNCGSFTFKVDQKQSPKNAASFVSLVQHGFFDKTTFHRIVPSAS